MVIIFCDKKYAFCYCCWLFGDESTKRSVWCTGYTDWKHLSKSAKAHGRSKAHLSSAIAASSFRKKLDIRHKLDNQITEEAKKWRTLLNIFSDTVRTLSGLGLALRGHRENLLEDENPGIYLSVIKLISRHKPILQAHIESSERVKYLSKTITFELLDILATETCQAIVNECKSAKFFALIADSTTDVAHLDQMAVLVRYVVINIDIPNSPKVVIKESFLCFVRLKKGDATSICNEITAILFEKFNFEKKYLCGQSYDGAPVMSGGSGGVQVKLKEFLDDGDGSFVPYIHCLSHQMNLVLIHAAEKNASSSIKVFFAHSHRRWEEILKQSESSSRTSDDFGIKLLKELKKKYLV
ncbi:PREDICTED: zinc finger MYM-type protein 1-like [Rhagoletis zephyria]|uniref:zinc finger MYM-type protein 1-like n=1 Tax=Rhagoletis zephyria TaxID=28612 RepID=UPI0008114A79|nr:PREDICTED: zinc finger MYM-type protein 1-like [Rhagoletis zephyria]